MRHSLSKWSCFNKCPAQYNYRYNLNLPSVQGPAAARGTDMHLSMELFVKGELSVLPGKLDFYASFLTGLKESSATLIPEEKIYVNASWEVCGVESAWVSSVLDLTVVQPMVLGVYDWKSGKVYPDHVNQKELYTIMAFAAHPGPTRTEAFHVYLDLNKTTKVTYELSDVDGLKAKWTERFKTLEYTDKFIPTPSFMCRYCDYSREKGGPCPF